MWSGPSHQTCTCHVSRIKHSQINCLAFDPMLKNTHLLTKFLRFVRLVLVMPNTDFQLSQHLSFRNTTSAPETHFSFADAASRTRRSALSEKKRRPSASNSCSHQTEAAGIFLQLEGFSSHAELRSEENTDNHLLLQITAAAAPHTNPPVPSAPPVPCFGNKSRRCDNCWKCKDD